MTVYDSPSDWVPSACTLPTAQQPLRRAEFDSLFATALRSIHRTQPKQLRMLLSGDADLKDQIADLTTRESECCSFFTFTVSGTEDAVVLDIAVPEAQVEVLNALAARAAVGMTG